jgi:hypothetical protein
MCCAEKTSFLYVAIHSLHTAPSRSSFYLLSVPFSELTNPETIFYFASHSDLDRLAGFLFKNSGTFIVTIKCVVATRGEEMDRIIPTGKHFYTCCLCA